MLKTEITTWIRRDRTTGVEEHISASDARNALQDSYLDFVSAMQEASKADPATNGFADYWPEAHTMTDVDQLTVEALLGLLSDRFALAIDSTQPEQLHDWYHFCDHRDALQTLATKYNLNKENKT